MALFDNLERILSRTVDRQFANEFTLHVVARTPNGRPTQDAYRRSWIGKGIFDEAPQDVPVESGRRDRSGNSLHTLVTGHSYELSVDRYAYPEANEAKQGDRITMTLDQRTFEITGIQRDGLSRIVFQLVEVR